MLDFYTRLAKRLHPFRIVFWVLAGAAVVAFVLTVLFVKGGHDETYMLGAVTLLLWVLFLSITIEAFDVPSPVVDPDDGFFRRLKTRVVRAVRWAVAALMTVLCLGVVVMSFRVISYLARAGAG